MTLHFSALASAALLILPIASHAQNGTPDQTYTRGVQTDIYAFAVQTTGFVAGGTRGTLTDSSGNETDLFSLNRYLYSSGAADPAFDVNPDGNVYALAQYADGRLLVAGDFSQINVAGNLTSATGIARLKADGTLDPTFQANVTLTNNEPTIVSVVVQPDGKILIGGQFDKVNNVSRGTVARLLDSGALDTTFNAGAGAAGGDVTVVALQGTSVLVGGDFTTFSAQVRPGLLRLNADGTFDSTFDAGLAAGSTVLALQLDSTGGVLIGGSQLTRGAQNDGALLRTDANGVLDTAFLAAVTPTPVNGAPDSSYAQNPPATPPPSFVAAFYLQPDGRVLAGGLFDGTVAGVAYHNLVRLFADGSLDASFVLPANPHPDQQPELLAVDALAVQPDGSLLVGTRVPQNYGRPFAGFPTDPVINIIINAVGLTGFSSPTYATAPGDLQATVTVKRSFGSAAGTLVYHTADGTAVAGRDYQSATGMLSWAAGDTTDRTFSVPVPATTQGGTVALTLTNAAQGVTIYPTGAKATLTIAPAPVPKIPVLTLSVAGKPKTSEGGPKVMVAFTRTGGDLTQPLPVTYKAKGDAVPGVNYKALSGQLTIPAGAAAASVKIKPLDDGIAGPKHSVIIKLKAPADGSYTLGNPKTVTISIKNSD